MPRGERSIQIVVIGSNLPESVRRFRVHVVEQVSLVLRGGRGFNPAALGMEAVHGLGEGRTRVGIVARIGIRLVMTTEIYGPLPTAMSR